LNKFISESGIRKRDLLAIITRADHILPFLKDRPLVMRRYAQRIGRKKFFQKERPNPFQADQRARCIPRAWREMDYIMAQRPRLSPLSHNLAASTIIHGPVVRPSGLPDYVFFDLDPTPNTPFSTVLRVARGFTKSLRKQIVCT